MFEKIIVGVDGSDPNRLVVEAAARLAASNGATLLLVHAEEILPGRMAPIHEAPAEVTNIRESAEAVAKGLGANVGGLITATVGLKGPAGALDEAAVENNADLIVVVVEVEARGPVPCSAA